MHSAKMTLFSVPLLYPTGGIHGAYRLVSTYDLPDSKPTGGGGYSTKSKLKVARSA